MLTFLPVRSRDDILQDIIKIKNEQALLKIRENKLVDELVKIQEEE
tara:strand:+ start:119 stop:256 length:138 start_codon:yes stop_codon:yes gene_type:complete